MRATMFSDWVLEMRSDSIKKQIFSKFNVFAEEFFILTNETTPTQQLSIGSSVPKIDVRRVRMGAEQSNSKPHARDKFDTSFLHI